MRVRVRFALSGVCALLAVGLCLLYGDQVREEVERERAEALERYGGEVVTLVVATRGIEPGEMIDGANAAEREWLVDLAPANAVTSLESVMGLEVSVPAAEGVPLTDLNFRDVEGSLDVPSDRVAISVPIGSDDGLPGTLEPGSVLAAYRVDEGVDLLSDDVQVLMASQGDSGLVGGGSMTVAVLPEDVAGILAASGEGSLRLALPGGEAQVETDEAAAAPTSVPAETTGASETEEGDVQ